MSVVGADTAQLAEVADLVASAANRTEERAARLSAQLASVAWEGPAANEFRAWWNRHGAPGMRHLASYLAAVSGDLLANSREQEAASTSKASAGTNSAGLVLAAVGAVAARSWLKRLGDDRVKPLRKWAPSSKSNVSYRVRRGDTLSGIAYRYGTSVSAVLAANPQITNPNLIVAGTALAIPSAIARPVAPKKAQPMPRSGAPTRGVGAPQGALAGSQRSWQDIRAAYTDNQHSNGLPALYKTDSQWAWQCTAWAYTRWRELGYTGAIVSPHGSTWAASNGGSANTPPTLGAAASYDSGQYGHVMVVEEVAAGGDRFRVSEMNAGGNGVLGTPDEYRSNQWFSKNSDGTWRSEKTGAVRVLTFAGVPR